MATQTVTAPTANIFAPKPTPAAASGAARPTERTRIYKEYLTPALHRRFVSAAGILLVFCWIEATVLSPTTHALWSWFPLGPAGLRALLLFAPCLAVFIVRVANIHVGRRNTTSDVQTVYHYLSRPKDFRITLTTLAWYMWSGWFFGEIYVWSRTEKAELGWVDPGQAYERPRLNENPVFLRCLFLLLGVAQAVIHLARDYDRIEVSVYQEDPARRQIAPSTSEAGQSTPSPSKLPRSLQQLHERLGRIANRAVNLTIQGLFLVTLPSYFLFLRRPAWSAAHTLGRMFFPQLSEAAPPAGFLNLPKLSFQAFSASFMLVALWEVSNALFDIFVAQPPLRRGEPLTNEVKDARGVVLQRSRDPNASLLTGLRSRRDVPKSFAFWELCLICAQFDQRRKTIYLEVDRKDGSTWDQVFKCCMDEIEQVQVRIAQANERMHPAPKPKPQEPALLPLSQPGARPGLPQIADQPAKYDEKVFAQRKPDLVETLGHTAQTWMRSSGQPDAITPRAKQALAWGTDRVLSKDQQARLTRGGLARESRGLAGDVLRSPLGEPFRQTFARRATAVVFGGGDGGVSSSSSSGGDGSATRPHSDAANLVHAARALAQLAVCSLREDDYGQVAKAVPQIVRLLTATIVRTEAFLRAAAPHWTDVLFTDADRDVPPVRHVLDALKQCLEDIVLAFGEYAPGLGLSKKEIREAREAAARSQAAPQPAVEMAQVGR